MEPKLILTFDSGRERYTAQINLGQEIASDMDRIVRSSVNNFSGAVEAIRSKTFRKQLFIRECQRIGEHLAELMEDAEGWHDESRIEPAKKSLKELA